MTRTEYREYIAGEKWRRRRNTYLEFYSECNGCGVPRWLASMVYDQDIHVHHRSYARIGAELDEDLEALCRRCHEVETFGKSKLPRIIPKSKCVYCEKPVYHTDRGLCLNCLTDHLNSPLPLEKIIALHLFESHRNYVMFAYNHMLTVCDAIGKIIPDNQCVPKELDSAVEVVLQWIMDKPEFPENWKNAPVEIDDMFPEPKKGIQ